MDVSIPVRPAKSGATAYIGGSAKQVKDNRRSWTIPYGSPWAALTGPMRPGTVPEHPSPRPKAPPQALTRPPATSTRITALLAVLAAVVMLFGRPAPAALMRSG